MQHTQALRRSPLHPVHREAGARLAPFAGWEMPVQYTGVVTEHLAVRTGAGLFDVSHMGQLELCGPDAGPALQYLTCNDLSLAAVGDAQYSALLDEKAGILDDVIVYRRSDQTYLVIVNAANTADDALWLQEHARGDVEIRDRSEEFALLALQGPHAESILLPMSRPSAAGLRPFQCADLEVGGIGCMVGRTGYTGEDGFEIQVPVGEAEKVWRALMSGGGGSGPVPVGLAARDTLRLEAGMLLHGGDITRETTPLEAGLGFIVRLDAGEFLGRNVLIEQKERGVSRRLGGLEMVDRGIARRGHRVWIDEEVRGEVTSGSYAPFLKKNIARAWFPPGAGPGTDVEVEIRNRRLRARVVKTPFYRRSRQQG